MYTLEKRHTCVVFGQTDPCMVHQGGHSERAVGVCQCRRGPGNEICGHQQDLACGQVENQTPPHRPTPPNRPNAGRPAILATSPAPQTQKATLDRLDGEKMRPRPPRCQSAQRLQIQQSATQWITSGLAVAGFRLPECRSRTVTGWKAGQHRDIYTATARGDQSAGWASSKERRPS